MVSLNNLTVAGSLMSVNLKQPPLDTGGLLNKSVYEGDSTRGHLVSEAEPDKFELVWVSFKWHLRNTGLWSPMHTSLPKKIGLTHNIWVVQWPFIVSMVKMESVYKVKVEKIEEDNLDLIPSPSPYVKIQITGGKVHLS